MPKEYTDVVVEILISKDPSVTLTKRDLFYQQPYLFRQQRVVDSIVDGLAQACNVPRRELGVVASPKGLAFGCLRIGELNFTRVPVTVITPGDLVARCELPQTVLVVEKEAVFNSLVQIYDQLSLPKLLIITGRGFPDLGTLQFVHWLSQRCSTLALVDYDPFGLDIALNYRRGSRLPADQVISCCSNLRFLGVTRQQLDAYQPHFYSDSRGRLKDAHEKRLERISKEASHLNWPEVAHAANDMLAAEFTAETEEVYGHNLTALATFINNEWKKLL